MTISWFAHYCKATGLTYHRESAWAAYLQHHGWRPVSGYSSPHWRDPQAIGSVYAELPAVRTQQQREKKHVNP